MILETIILVAIAIVCSIYVYLTWNFNVWKKRGIIGPKPKLLLGNLPNIILQSRNVFYDMDEIYHKYKNIDRFVGVFEIRKPKLLAIDPKFVREVTVTNFKSFTDNDVAGFMDPKVDILFALNPFVLSGAEWKEKRSEITPAFTPSRIKASFPILLSVCDRMTKYLEHETKIPKTDGFDARKLAARFTMEVVGNCIYGFEVGAFKLNQETCELMEMTAGLLDWSFFDKIYMALVQLCPNIRRIYSKPWITKKTESYLVGLTKHAIELREANKSDRADFLNYLLQLRDKKNLTLLEITARVTTFYFDGFETSSVLISNCLYLLAQHENVQNRLRQQIKECVAANNGEISFEQLNEMPYLDQVVNETLRLIPPGAYINKLCTESCQLVNANGCSVQMIEGDSVIIPIACIHRDEEYYTDAEKFIPERFDPENGGVKKYRDLGVFLPFGDGPRMCLGQKFALTQSKAAIAEIVKNWKVTLNEKCNKKFVASNESILFYPEGGVWIDLERI